MAAPVSSAEEKKKTNKKNNKKTKQNKINWLSSQKHWKERNYLCPIFFFANDEKKSLTFASMCRWQQNQEKQSFE